MSEYTKVTKTSAIREGRGKSFTVNGKRIAILNENGKFCAVGNTCPHAMGSLGRGRIRNGIVVCPVHGYAYNTKTGECVTDPRLRIRVYPVIVEDEEIRVQTELE
jgi:nitrite reductase/ring-hydroxylating ferredoxin subunit